MGQTITLSHLAPYVDISRKKIRKQVEEELAGVSITEEEKNKIVESRVKKEIHNGVQTIQYQVLTLLTTNGQTPFLSVNMYLGEVKDERTKNDLAMIIEETLLQRIQGVKNEKGVWVTPAFPKLLYVLEEDNIHEDSKYWYLTVLAAKCTAKRMVPDYISEKKMLEYKIDKNGNGNAYPCMGCLEGSEVVSYIIEETKFTESIDRMFERFSRVIPATPQRPGDRDHLYIDLPKGVKIYDNKLNDYVDCVRLISNRSRKWRRIDFGTRCVTVTYDHPFETENRGVVLAKDLLPTDSIYANFSNRDICDFEMFDLDSAWLCGFVAGYTAKFDKFDYTFMEENAVTERVIKAFKTALLMDVSVAPMSDVSIMKHLVPSEADKDRYESFLRGCSHKFDGHNNIDNAIFRWDGEPRIAFIAGLIDSGCYEDCYDSIHLLSREHEMISQFMYLVQSLGIPVEMGIIHGPSDSLKSALYYIDFVPEGKVLEVVTDESVKAKFSGIAPRVVTDNIVHPVQIEDFEEDMWSYDVTTSSEHFSFGGIYSHNCRSFLTPYVDENNKPKYYGRFNQGVVTINLPFVALVSEKDMDKFWSLLDHYLELCHDALMTKHKRLLGTVSDVAPILWQYGALARLKKGETIDKLLFDGYSTISLGFCGLYECVKYMTGKAHTDPSAKPFALQVEQYLNDKCKLWKSMHNIDFSVYGTPLETVTYKFAKANKDKFGIIEGITDHNYVTNSYHVNVREHIDAFKKLKFESEFQKLAPGGAISYVEVPNMQNNIPAVLKLIQYIYDNIMYAELNTKSDYCMECGYDGEIQIKEDSGKLIWECPNCGNRDQSKMSVARRTCGYIGTNFWNQGRTEEIRDRVLHL